MDAGIEERLKDDNFVSEAPDMLYEEDIEDEFNGVDEGIDNPTPIDAGALAGDVEEDGRAGGRRRSRPPDEGRLVHCYQPQRPQC